MGAMVNWFKRNLGLLVFLIVMLSIIGFVLGPRALGGAIGGIVVITLISAVFNAVGSTQKNINHFLDKHPIKKDEKLPPVMKKLN